MFVVQASSRLDVSTADLTQDGSFAESYLRVDVDPASPDSLLSVEAIGSGAFGFAPQGGSQEAWLEVVKGGATHREGAFPGGIEAAFAPEGTSFTLRSEAFSGDEIAGAHAIAWHGYEIDRKAAPPGVDVVNLQMRVVHDSTTTTVYPLVTGGRAWNSKRDLIGHNPMEIGLQGYLSRFERVKITYIKEAGVSLTHGEIIIALLNLLGVPNSRIAISPDAGTELLSQLEIICTEGLPEIRRIALTARSFLAEDGDGLVVLRPMAPIDEQPVATISLDLVATSEVEATIESDNSSAPTCVRVEGALPIIPDFSDGFTTTRRLESETIEPYTVPASWTQSAAGAIVAANAAFTEDRITSQIWVTETYFRGCLVSTVREVWGQVNPEVWRYQTATPASADGEPRTYRATLTTGFVFGDGAVKDDSLPMRRWLDFRLAPVTVERTDFIREGPIEISTGLPDPYSGFLVQVVKSTSQWSWLENAQKTKTSPSNTWDDEFVRAAIRFFGGGKFVTGLGSASEAAGFAEEVWFEGPSAPDFALGNVAGMGTSFFGGNSSLPGEPSDMIKLAKYAAQTTETITIVEIPNPRELDAGHESARVIVDTGYRFDNLGDQWLPQGSSSKGSATEEGFVLRAVNKNFVPSGDFNHSILQADFDGDGKFVQLITSLGEGFLPNADICIPETLNQNSIPISGKCCIVSDDYDTAIVQTEAFDFGIEDEGWAYLLACDILREATAFTIICEMPMSPVFYPGAPIVFSAIHKGIDPADFAHVSNAWVQDVQINAIRPDRGPVRKVVVLTIRMPLF